ncbi:hypothetical protein MCP_2795 [Methanocella paludicola SANAE]|uniref:Uncharacterized protein n=2 Tax=Methanocella TaxID=570266 RepID=D1Z2E5_METPS|nr:hypothetical protein MCP_2795 [Methanocella paludicola SANAE]
MGFGQLKSLIIIVAIGLITFSQIPLYALSEGTNPGCTIYGYVYINDNSNPVGSATLNCDGQQATSAGSGFYQFKYTIQVGKQVTIVAQYNGHEVRDTFTVPNMDKFQRNIIITIETPTTTPTPSNEPSTSPQPTAHPTARAPSDVDDWILGPGLWSTPTPTPVPTATPTSIITATPTVLPTPTPTPEPTAAAQTTDLSSWWWLILLLITVALVAGYWYFTKQK